MQTHDQSGHQAEPLGSALEASPDGSKTATRDTQTLAAVMPTSRMASIGALLAGLAVALGAFGTHALRARLDSTALALWKTAVDYQMSHALAILTIGIAAGFMPSSLRQRLRPALLCLVVGVIVFCGSLCAIALGAPRFLGMLAPLGGSLLLIGWAWLGVALWPKRSHQG